MIKVRISRWRDYFILLGGPNVITRVLIRGKQEYRSQRRKCDARSKSKRVREIFENVLLLTLKSKKC